MASSDQDEVLRELRCSTDFVLVRRRRRGRGTHGSKDKKGSPGAPWKERSALMADRSAAKGKRWRRYKTTEGDAADDPGLLAGATSSSERVVVRAPVSSAHHPAHRGGDCHYSSVSSSPTAQLLRGPPYSSPSSSRSSSASPVPSGVSSWQTSRAGTDDNDDDNNNGTAIHVSRAASRGCKDDVIGDVAALLDHHHRQQHHHLDDVSAVDETLPRRSRQKKNVRGQPLRITEVFSSICSSTGFHNPRSCQTVRPSPVPPESQNTGPTSGGQLHLENEAIPLPKKPCPHFRRCHGAGGALRPDVLDFSPTRRSAWLEVSADSARTSNNSSGASAQRYSYQTIPVCCSPCLDSTGGGGVVSSTRGTTITASKNSTTTNTSTTCDNAGGSEDRHDFEAAARTVPAGEGGEEAKKTSCSCCNNISKPCRDARSSGGPRRECLVCDSSYGRTESQTFVLDKKNEKQTQQREVVREKEGSQETCGSSVTSVPPSWFRCSCHQRRRSLPANAVLALPHGTQTTKDSRSHQQCRGQCCLRHYCAPSYHQQPKGAVTCQARLDLNTNAVTTTTTTSACLTVAAPCEAPSPVRPASEACTASRWPQWTRMLRTRHVGRCLLLLLLTGLGGLFARVTITDFHAHGPPGVGDMVGGFGGGGLQFGGVGHDGKHPVNLLMKMHLRPVPLREFHARLRTIRTKFDLLRIFLDADMTDDSLKQLLAHTETATASSNDAFLAGPRPDVTERGRVTTTVTSDNDDNAPPAAIANPLAAKNDVTPSPKDRVVLTEASVRSDAKLMSSSSKPKASVTQTDVNSPKSRTKASKRSGTVLSNSGVEPLFKKSDRSSGGSNKPRPKPSTAVPNFATLQGPNDAVRVKQTTDKSMAVRLSPAVDTKLGTVLGDAKYTNVKKRDESYDDFEDINVEDYLDGEADYHNDDANNDALLEELEEAAYHIADMENNKHAVCKDPQPQVIYVEDPKKLNRQFYPECTVVHRCRKDSGCCGRNYECAAKTQRVIMQTFLAVRVDRTEDTVLLDNEMVERIPLVNHTECECQEKPRLPDCTQQCPGVFEAYRYGWQCVCDCISTPNERFPQCDNVKDGLYPLTQEDLVCIKSGRCGKPKCTVGEFNEATGFCPLYDTFSLPSELHRERLRHEHRLRHERMQRQPYRQRHARRKSVPEGSGDF